MSEKLESFLKEVEAMSVNALTVTEKLLEDGSRARTIELAHRKVMPERMESPARAHVFHDAAGFAAYLAANRSEHLVVLIDTASLTAQAVLDDRAAKGFETIRFEPPNHPQYDLFEKCLLGNFEVQEFAEGVMMCRDLIVGVDGDGAHAGRDLAMLMKQIRVANKVTAEHGVGNDCLNGVMIETKVTAGTASSSIALPQSITIRTPLFLNTVARQFELQVTVVPRSAERVLIRTSAPELPVLRHALFEEMLSAVKAIGGALVTYGQVQTAGWSYNK
jgi:hypothetical protein